LIMMKEGNVQYCGGCATITDWCQNLLVGVYLRFDSQNLAIFDGRWLVVRRSARLTPEL